jgi:hypothetical protein
MSSDTARKFISHMDTLSNSQRERVLSALINRYCVCCGAKGDWTEKTCDCEPDAPIVEEEDPQLWLNYSIRSCSKAA